MRTAARIAGTSTRRSRRRFLREVRQVAVEALLAALRGVDVAVDGLVADGRPSVRFLLEPAGDLLRRPAVLEPPDHVLTQGGVGGELPTPLPASPRQVLGVQGEVAAEAA